MRNCTFGRRYKASCAGRHWKWQHYSHDKAKQWIQYYGYMVQWFSASLCTIDRIYPKPLSWFDRYVSAIAKYMETKPSDCLETNNRSPFWSLTLLRLRSLLVAFPGFLAVLLILILVFLLSAGSLETRKDRISSCLTHSCCGWDKLQIDFEDCSILSI